MMNHCDLHDVDIDRRGCPWCSMESLEYLVSEYRGALGKIKSARVEDCIDAVHCLMSVQAIAEEVLTA